MHSVTRMNDFNFGVIKPSQLDGRHTRHKPDKLGGDVKTEQASDLSQLEMCTW